MRPDGPAVSQESLPSDADSLAYNNKFLEKFGHLPAVNNSLIDSPQCYELVPIPEDLLIVLIHIGQIRYPAELEILFEVKGFCLAVKILTA